jgi:histidinol-phosphate phosphatase family protein
MNLKDLNIDKSWTLFLDRDGVINKKRVNDYVLHWDQFEFLPGVLEAMKKFKECFGKIIIVTNQQGIGKGLMTEYDLELIHEKMIAEIRKNGGDVDAVFYAPQTSESNHNDRKPNTGMALRSRKRFPEIHFKRSLIAGDSKSDMEFGHRLGMVKVLVNTDNSLAKEHPALVDISVETLKQLSLLL